MCTVKNNLETIVFPLTLRYFCGFILKKIRECWFFTVVKRNVKLTLFNFNCKKIMFVTENLLVLIRLKLNNFAKLIFSNILTFKYCNILFHYFHRFSFMNNLKSFLTNCLCISTMKNIYFYLILFETLGTRKIAE